MTMSHITIDPHIAGAPAHSPRWIALLALGCAGLPSAHTAETFYPPSLKAQAADALPPEPAREPVTVACLASGKYFTDQASGLSPTSVMEPLMFSILEPATGG
jgi:hypothetical protein